MHWSGGKPFEQRLIGVLNTELISFWIQEYGVGLIFVSYCSAEIAEAFDLLVSWTRNEIEVKTVAAGFRLRGFLQK